MERNDFINIGICLIGIFVGLSSCSKKDSVDKEFLKENVAFISEQLDLQLQEIEKTGEFLYPRSIKNGNVYYTPIQDWCVGFFPSNLWMTYKLTGDEYWKDYAQKFTESLDTLQHLTTTHDLGFMVGCPYLAGIRFANKEEYKQVIVQAAKSLSSRFRPNVGVIQSWDVDKGWQKKRGWKCPVIIDNMMNLELLFEASLFSGDSTYYNIATKHANVTLANHFREDNSSYHVVDYDPESGNVRSRQTAQGYSDASAWVVYGLGNNGYEIKLSSAADNSAPVLGTVTAGQDTLVNVYVYYEGSDTNIHTKNLQEDKLDESQSVKINFTATADNQ